MIFLYYIQEADKPNLFYKIFNIIEMQQDKIILPINGEEISDKKSQKLAKKTKKIMEKAISKKIVLSKKIQKQEIYKNLLYTYNLEIIEGKWIKEVLCCKELEFLLKHNKLKKEDTSISILINDITENMLSNIRIMAKEYKSISIITNHIEKFKKIEKQILEDDGVMITVGNNKKKGLAKAKIILNVDFPSELINKYQICEKAIIINIKENAKVAKKRFNGIIIQDCEIIWNETQEFDYEKQEKYKSCERYEAKINKKQPFKEIQKQIKKDKVQISKLIGINTEIF